MPPDPRQSAAREVYLNSREVMNRYGASSMWIWRRLRDELGFPQPALVVATRRFLALERNYRMGAVEGRRFSWRRRERMIFGKSAGSVAGSASEPRLAEAAWAATSASRLSHDPRSSQAAQRSAARPLFAPLPEIEGGWRCVAADPAWRFKSNSAANPGRNAMRHYDCLSLDEIASLPLREVVAKDALLWLWVTGPFLARGEHVAVMRAWEFEPTAIGFTWVKLNRNAPELFIQRRDLFMGPGLTTRKNCEFVILGRRGRPERLATDVHEVILSRVREPSRKPAEAYSRIERYCPGPRLELFARESRENWTTWGDESAKFDQSESPSLPDYRASGSAP